MRSNMKRNFNQLRHMLNQLRFLLNQKKSATLRNIFLTKLRNSKKPKTPVHLKTGYLMIAALMNTTIWLKELVSGNVTQNGLSLTTWIQLKKIWSIWDFEVENLIFTRSQKFHKRRNWWTKNSKWTSRRSAKTWW